jgi:hypothetical protein
MRVGIHKAWQRDTTLCINDIGIRRCNRLDLIPGPDSLDFSVSRPQRSFFNDPEMIQIATDPRDGWAGQSDQLFAINDDQIARHLF